MNKNTKFDGVAFKLIGVVVIFVLLLFLCDPARGESLTAEDVAEVNTWNPVHELHHKDYGAANSERDRLIIEYEVIAALAAYTWERIDNFDAVNGLDNLDVRKKALLELITETNHVYLGLIREITWFVKNHTKGGI